MPFRNNFNYKIFQYILGLTICFIGYSLLIPLTLAIVNKEPTVLVFSISAVFSLILGYYLIYFNRNYTPQLTKKDGRIIVGLIWFVAPIIGALPYLLSPIYFKTPINALFESFSGFTTTGSTILNHLETMPKSILIWRALTQWIGGLGLTLIIIILLNNFKNGSNYLFNAEFTSIDKEKVRPHIKDSVFKIIYIYVGLTIISIILLRLGDMDLFTSICHSFGAVSTGGFSTVNNNIGEFSPYTQYVLTAIMFLSGIGYVLLYWFVKFRWGKLFKDEQSRVYIIIIFLASFILFFSLYLNRDFNIEKSIRIAIFHIVSVVSTTGYYLPEAQEFGLFISTLILILMFIGGCSGSSSTGLKIIRLIILLKYSNNSFKRMFHPRAIIPIRYNKVVLIDEATNLVFGFFFLYLIIFIIGAFTLTLFGNEFMSSIAMSAANISNIGPVIGYMSPEITYSNLDIGSKTTLIILMMIGRLEIYSFLAMFSKSIWTKN
ncbi:MAG: potassium transporter TrkG [Bacteroidales bacterium]|nr:potassium transporter TrkG [Bacteroidales bacterium]MDD4001540.1 potassium transporter TrkG [Bacteroidales bacterium]MDD4529377.1 potassium transporter TrkG [Bacteroidales bacterium]MDD4829333.1 potassium transporter TrkG [Bacteroidales bacterium]